MDIPTLSDLAALTSPETLHSHVMHMRIIPFDLKSLGGLLATTTAPLVLLVVRFIKLGAISHLMENLGN